MKVIFDNWNYYKYPQGIENIEQFVAYLNENYHSFIKLEGLSDKNCIPPFFIEENVTTLYVNAARLVYVREEEVTVMKKKEYEKCLDEAVKLRCPSCVHYEHCVLGDGRHASRISLNGECEYFADTQEDERM